MGVRPEVEAFVALGALPNERSDQPLEVFQERLEKITEPVSDEEAELLVGMFGPDGCFGLAWTVLHLIETAPGGCPIKQEPTSSDNEWVQTMWGRYSRELLVDALRRWHSAKRDQLIEAGIRAMYLDSPTVGDRSARLDLDSELVIGRATVWNRGFCDLELLAVHTGEQILYRHHESVSGIRLWAVLDELADQMAST